jgi:hypothetical protein
MFPYQKVLSIELPSLDDLQSSCGICSVQELLGHAYLKKMIYTYVPNVAARCEQPSGPEVVFFALVALENIKP